jgi:hypothetical protein
VNKHISNLLAATSVLTAALLFAPGPGMAQRPASAPAGSIPRLPNGKPDLSGVWERPAVLDMSKNGPGQQAPAEFPLTAWAKANMGEKFDSSGHCLPMGYTRHINSPFPVEIEQRPDRLVILYEANNTFHIVYTDGRDHPKDLEPTWFGHSIGKWDGDTLVVDTTGFNEKTLVDTFGHPHSDALHVIERFTRTDAAHIAYEIAIEDPKAYTKPWKNVRTFTLRPDWELVEYVCEENNRDLVEGHIK